MKAKERRTFVDRNLELNTWENLKPYFNNLENRSIESIEAYKQWLRDRSELDAVLEEDCAWRYIRMTIDTRDEKLTEAYTYFVTKIQPELAPYEDILNKKATSYSYFQELQTDPAYAIYFRSIETSLKLFRKENIELEAQLSEKSQQYGAISAAQTITHGGEEITMQKASLFLKETDENLRKEVYTKIAERRRMDSEKLDNLFSELIELRHQVALNAGFSNYRDYKFAALGRFDYSKEECFEFHSAIKSLIVPIVKNIQAIRLKKLTKTKFRPWDLEVDPDGLAPLKPFEGGDKLLAGTINMFAKLDPYFASCIQEMDRMGHLDLDSKPGKAPGGYNYPLYETGAPFIFMNSVGAQRDLVTMVHEGGHAIHSFLSKELELTGFKNLPSEVAELASMSMELLTMELWNEFYSNDEDCKRAKKEQLESILKILPWIAQIDEFQHWVYENPNHLIAERHEKWISLCAEYGTGLTDFSDFEDQLATSWQRQLHLFEVPFYYIEYGIAQLGALGVWKNSLTDKKSAINNYKNALKLGYTRSIPEIYSVAGVKFDFTADYLKELAAFVQQQLEITSDQTNNPTLAQ